MDSPQIIRFSDLDDIWVSAVSPQAIPAVTREITSLLRDRHHIADAQPNDFRVRDLTEISQSLASTSTLMTNLLLCVALISLMVGGVGIMNIMLVSVTERTREIGLRMAVGVCARDILRQFLIEAILLCLAGGFAGILLGRGFHYADRPFELAHGPFRAGDHRGRGGLRHSGRRLWLLPGMEGLARSDRGAEIRVTGLPRKAKVRAEGRLALVKAAAITSPA